MMKSEQQQPDDQTTRGGLRRPSIEESALILFQMMKQSPPSPPPERENTKPSRWDQIKPSSNENNQKYQTNPSTNNSHNNSPNPSTTSTSHFGEESEQQQQQQLQQPFHTVGGSSNNHTSNLNYNYSTNNETGSPSSSCHLSSCLLCTRGQPLLLIKSPTWASIMRVVFFCLKQDFPNKHFFSLKTDVYSFMLCHWEKLCLNKKRSDNWHKQIQDMLSHSKNLFESGMDKYKQNGYWRLKQMIDPWTIQKDRSSKKLPNQPRSPKRPIESTDNNGSPNPTPPSSNSPRDEEQEEEQIEFETLRIPTSHNSPLKKMRLNSPPASPELKIDDETEYSAKSNSTDHNAPRTPTPTRNLSSPPNPVIPNYHTYSKPGASLNNSHVALPPASPPQSLPTHHAQHCYPDQPQPHTGFVGEVQSLRTQLSSMTESLLAIRAQLRKKPLPPSALPHSSGYAHPHPSTVAAHHHTPVYSPMPMASSHPHSHYGSMTPYGYRLYSDEHMWCYDDRMRKAMASGLPASSYELPPIASLPHARPPTYSSPHYVFSPPSSACTTPNISSSPDIHMSKVHPFYSHSIISPHMSMPNRHNGPLYSSPPPRTISMVANH
eukprot:TRINITY_DN3158_c0_g1_i2.p1 TRINITY_DN3158_c0_g1~~TRINITY_DN3158_c0_g1_i2.p1  ORF type:complete len:603 (-),score=140.84 TRINITY_DN3158_c0_g1_i2:401-2209(-)